MKSRMFCLSVITALFTFVANAQTIGTRLTADVPFAFTAGSTKLPAGHYQVDSPLPNVIRLSTLDKSVSAMLLVNGSVRGASDRDAKLVFNKYGERCFLASVFAPGANSGVGVKPSAAEREFIAAAKTRETQVIVARRQ
jgi:hypothetical protein